MVLEYGQIDHELLYKTASEDIPDLISIIQTCYHPWMKITNNNETVRVLKN